MAREKKDPKKKGRIKERLKKIFNKENAKKPIFWGGVTGVVGLLMALIVGMIAFTEQPVFCNTCHIMKGPYEVWEKSTHARVRCTVCHVKPGLYEMLLHKPKGLLEVWAVITRNPAKPAEVHPPDNENCNLCHKAKRKVSTTGDLKMPHEAHIKLRGLKCVDCHRNLVHTVNPRKKNLPTMITCYKCHDGKKAPNSCTACHTEKAVPEDHKSAEWTVVHSSVQQGDPSYCEKCHGWVKDYCSECHQRRPKSHMTKWRTNHQTKIAADGKLSCAKCHQNEMCIRCHGIIP